MKTIPLKTVTDTTPGQPETEFDYARVMITILTGANPQGLTIEDMRKRMRIADALEAGQKTGECELEDADYIYLIQIIRGHRWPRAFEAAIQMEDDLKKAGGQAD